MLPKLKPNLDAEPSREGTETRTAATVASPRLTTYMGGRNKRPVVLTAHRSNRLETTENSIFSSPPDTHKKRIDLKQKLVSPISHSLDRPFSFKRICELDVFKTTTDRSIDQPDQSIMSLQNSP